MLSVSLHLAQDFNWRVGIDYMHLHKAYTVAISHCAAPDIRVPNTPPWQCGRYETLALYMTLYLQDFQ